MVGLDSINDYYDVMVKHGRLKELGLPVPEPASPGIVASSIHDNLRFIVGRMREQ